MTEDRYPFDHIEHDDQGPEQPSEIIFQAGTPAAWSYELERLSRDMNGGQRRWEDYRQALATVVVNAERVRDRLTEAPKSGTAEDVLLRLGQLCRHVASMSFAEAMELAEATEDGLGPRLDGHGH